MFVLKILVRRKDRNYKKQSPQGKDAKFRSCFFFPSRYLSEITSLRSQFAVADRYKSRDLGRDRSSINLRAAKKSTICLKVPEQGARRERRCIMRRARKKRDIKGGNRSLRARSSFLGKEYRARGDAGKIS